MPSRTNPPGFWIDFPEPETYLVDVDGKSETAQVDKLNVMSDRKSITVKYGGKAADKADNKIQLPRDAEFLRDLAKEFTELAALLEARRGGTC